MIDVYYRNLTDRGKREAYVYFKINYLFSFIFFMVQNVQSIIKRKRFVSYSKYVGHVKQAVNEINVDMVQEVTQMYDEAGKMVDASVLINNLRILTGVLFVFHPVVGAFVYHKPLLTLVAFGLSMAYLVGNYCLEQILAGSEKKGYFMVDYIVDHMIPFLNLGIVILMSIYL